MISYYNRVGFAEFTLTAFITVLAIIMALSGMLYMEISLSKKKDETIRILNSQKVHDDSKSENKIHEVEHSTIAKSIPKQKVSYEEINISNGSHSIKFK